MAISVFDTNCGSFNSGDAVIMKAVSEHLHRIFPHEHLLSFPTHYPLSITALLKARKCAFGFVGGTNLLSSRMRLQARKNQWSIGPLGALMLQNRMILMGCGWDSDQTKYSFNSKLLYTFLLSQKFTHSVRDSHTENMLRAMGFQNVLNTGCPTLWDLSEKHCNSIPCEKARDVVFTLTDYRQHRDHDRAMVISLLDIYQKVYFWKQGRGDFDYLKCLIGNRQLERLERIDASLNHFDHLLANSASLDYVGTRLHAGIRAIQHGRRAVIIAVDNRAREMRDDIRLNVIDRGGSIVLEEFINGPIETAIRLPTTNIAKWKSQFRNEH
jgi:polysaccharide pyruvyl transferase WcaK-like protein